ncbi:hypothetical protein V2W30_15195 [Streptomyces sp. Q6]|uniref:Uncharacterized protein n=1 Tax=Streptomyces citrinus TaxID=3118173 RepID=A0ACD5ABH4_9ACTN
MRRTPRRSRLLAVVIDTPEGQAEAASDFRVGALGARGRSEAGRERAGRGGDCGAGAGA